jgi:predicted MFS family arabinose efflux permease
MRSDRARLAPLMLATMASQALIVVLAPTIVAVGADLGASVGAAGQARSVTAGAAILASAAIAGRIDSVGISRLLAAGAAVAIIASAAVAAAPNLVAFLLAHVLVGIALACLLSAGFAGVAGFTPERRAWAIGYVAGANALAWIAVTPVVGMLTERLSWRAAEAVPATLAVGALLASKRIEAAPAAPGVASLGTLLAHPSARRWIGAELAAYGAWACVLTYVGAFFIEGLGVREGVAGWLLAAGAASFFAASTRSGRLAAALPRRPLAAAASLAMAVFVLLQMGVAASAAGAAACFCLVGLAAGVRTPASGGLGLDQLPEHPGAMMAARTAAAQTGYLLGAVVGGAVIAVAGYRALGLVLATGLAVAAYLILRVDDPRAAAARAARVSPSPSL